MKFTYGQRVKIIDGFYRGSFGVVTQWYQKGLVGGHKSPLDYYMVLLLPPDWIGAQAWIASEGHLRKEFPESNLEAAP